MEFSSPTFLFLFLPIVFILNLMFMRNIGVRNVLLTIFSVVFYAWGEPVYVLLMFLSTFVNYALSLRLGEGSRGRKLALWLMIVFNIGTLVVFKYTDFLISSVNAAFTLSIPLAGIPLPIGVSFFTFQAMSYSLDVYKGTTKPQRNYGHILLYISLFPQLIAGPIVKYHDVAEQIKHRTITIEKTATGLRRFIVGLGKKVLISNILAMSADAVYALPTNDITAPIAWLGAICYLLQIYFDFSGYSDMAIGLGRMFGFDFKENFNYPYTADSMQDFWRRWHISLSSWFREYVYIPLGGNRKGLVRTGVNRVIVFLLTGLWHGASWNFVIWGLFHGGFLMLEGYGVLKPSKWPKVLRHVYALLAATVGFVFFRAETLGSAVSMLSAMFTRFSIDAEGLAILGSLMPPLVWIMLVVGIFGSLPIWRDKVLALEKKNTVFKVCAYSLTAVLLVLLVSGLSTNAYNPFIYFRF